MNKRIFLVLVAVMALVSLSLSWAMTQEKPKAPATAAQKTEAVTFKFKGGSCQIAEFIPKSMFAPADMKEEEKAVMLRFTYTLDSGAEKDALSALYHEGKLAAPDGKTCKAGASVLNETIYSLIVAVPKDLDVETLSFVFGNQKALLKPLIKK
jgi:hypothetical protein